jgi:integrase
MAVYKDGDKWRVIYRFTNYKGEHKQTTKRGFATKREAVAWERQQILKDECKLDMTFASFFELYEEDRKKRVKQNTWESKGHVIRTKILPYFGDRKMDEIKPTDVLAWQNEIMAGERQGGGEYSPTYLKTIHAQLSAIFNYAVKYYNLKENPCHKAGSIGKKNAEETLFWTKEEFASFIETMKDRPISYTIFMTMYYTGIREGELLALTPADIDFEKSTLTINKSYQRLNGQNIISTPKTPKSNRVITLPEGLKRCLKEYIERNFGIKQSDRLFPFNKSYLTREMKIGCERSGVKKIRIHDLRNSHASLLVEIGFSPLLIAEKLGHERVQTTMETYSHIYPNKQIEVADKLDDLIA